VRSVLVISGLDPSGGAGFLADVRVIADLGLRAVGVVTVLTEQDTGGVRAVHPVSAEVVGAQLTALLSDVEVAAVKIGALGDAAIVDAVARALDLTAAPVVWDPVLAPTAGAAPLSDVDPGATLAALARHLSIVTPNLAEAARLTGAAVDDVAAMHAAARSLAGVAGAALVKGGHLAGAPVDVLAIGADVRELVGARVAGPAVHGTGCALSTSLAARLALGASLADAAGAAIDDVRRRIATPVRAGRGAPSVA
jgi:hydroxymethylpyrimidine/phosphomethylpyrimidine kinase